MASKMDAGSLCKHIRSLNYCVSSESSRVASPHSKCFEYSVLVFSASGNPVLVSHASLTVLQPFHIQKTPCQLA